MAADWPMQGGNPQRTGVYPDGGIKPPLVVKWMYEMAPDAGAAGTWGVSPVVAGSTVYHGTRTTLLLQPCRLRAFDAGTGALLWSKDPGGDETSWPVYKDGYLYMGIGSDLSSPPVFGTKMRLSDRITMWSVGTSKDTCVLPAESSTYLMQICNKPTVTLYCVDDSTGAVNWAFTVTATGSYTGIEMAFHSGVVFVPDQPLYAIHDDPTAPRVKWRHSYPKQRNQNTGVPVVSNGRVYFAFSRTYPGAQLDALDEESGDLKWSFQVPGKDAFSCSVDGSRIYMPVKDGYLYAIDDVGPTWSLAWKTDIGYAFQGGGGTHPIIAGDYVYVMANDPSEWAIRALDKSDGTIVWSRTLPSFGGSDHGSPAMSNGLIYAPTNSHIVCLGKPVSVGMGVDKGTAGAGDALSYTLTVNSYGGPSGSVTLVVTLPAEFEYVASSDGGMAKGGMVVWEGLSVTTDTVREITVNGRVKGTLSPGSYDLAVRGYLDYPGLPSDLTESLSDVVRTAVYVPGPPAGLVVRDTCGGIALTWQTYSAGPVTGYRVYRSTAPGVGRVRVAETGSSATAYFDTNVTASLSYYYVLTTISGVLESVPSVEAGVLHSDCRSVPPPPPYSGPVRVYPNPFSPGKAVRGTVKFEGLAPGSEVRVYTSAGLKVWEGRVTLPNAVEWDGKTGSGRPVAPGTYMWVAEGGGRKERGTLIVESK